MRIIAVLIMTATGVGAQSATTISDLAYRELNARASQNQSQFLVYKDDDSPFNHEIGRAHV